MACISHKKALWWGEQHAQNRDILLRPSPPRHETSRASSGHDMSFPFMAANPDPVLGKRLDSWKEIAHFLGRAERTVKRWEAERGLPVHRVPGGGRSAVFAYNGELANWLKGRTEELDADDTASGETAELPRSVPEAVPIAPTVPAKPFAFNVGVAAWMVPLVLTAGLVIYFSIGHRDSRFKAMASRRAPNQEAQDLYLKGRYFWDRRTPDDLNKAIDYFTQAIVKDPSDAQAYVGLADCYNLLREFGSMPPGEAYPRAISAAERAVELDDTSAEAHISLAFGTYWWSWKGVTAEREFKRALELDPKSVRAHHWYATYLFGMNRFPEAIDEMEQARRLDPSSNAILADKGFLLWQAGHKSEGLTLLTQLEVTEPSLSSTHAYLGRVYWDQKNYAKSLAESRRAAELRHDENGLRLANAREKGFAVGGLKGLYENELPMDQDLVERGSGSAYALATAYAALGKKQEAFASLQTSLDRHEAAMLIGDDIPELMNHPQYQKFRAQVAQLLAR
ncbi:MAG TPA: tetratricopeptide repeat protein [Terriglobales bacterium]